MSFALVGFGGLGGFPLPAPAFFVFPSRTGVRPRGGAKSLDFASATHGCAAAHGWRPQTAKPRFCNCNPRAHCSPRVAHGNSYCSRSVRQAGPAGCFAEAAKHWRQTAPKTIMVALRRRAPCGIFGGNAGLRCRRSEICWGKPMVQHSMTTHKIHHLHVQTASWRN